MEYEESSISGYTERDEVDSAEGVHIRLEDRGVMMYAVFDSEEQVSEEYGPLNDAECISFMEGYSKGKENYSQS